MAYQANVAVRALIEAEGLVIAGVAAAEPLLGAREAALRGLDDGRLEGMAWMTPEWIERATDPERFLSGARSLIVAGLPYHSPEPAIPGGDGRPRGKIARYARGRDYHRVFESKLRRIVRAIRTDLGGEARATVDYGPLLERPIAALAGIGWQGKSTMLLVPGAGPWVLLGAIATSLELEPGQALKKSCGSCTRCIEACPTGAISAEGGEVDARLCISYHTIENRGAIPHQVREGMGDRVFGCDDCLDACPVGAGLWETYAEFEPPGPEYARPVLAGLLSLDEAAFAERYRGRAVMRAKRDGLVRNACIALGNTGRPEDLDALEAALGDASALVRGHAAWAIGRLGQRTDAPGWEAMLVATAMLEKDEWVSEEIRLALAEAGAGGPYGRVDHAGAATD
jgi:epoxyqueuosine reductase